MALQGCPQRDPRFYCRGRTRNDNDVEVRNRPTNEAEGFADLAFNEVAHDRFCGDFAGDGDAQTGMTKRVGSRVDCKVLVAVPLSGAQRSAIINTCQNSEGFRQPLSGRRRRSQALSRARPRARRALMTARPPAVLMRARNPWVRLRFSTLGW